jgi:hypothetical protein
MTKLKLSAIPDDKPGKLSVELPADVHRDLLAYANYLNTQYVFVSRAGGEQCRI